MKKMPILSVLAAVAAGILSAADAQYDFKPWIGADGRPLTLGAAPRTVPTGCPAFTVDRPREHGGPTVDAADFGVSEEIDDNNATLQRAIDHCRAVGARKLVMKKGTYRFFGPRSVVFDSLTDFTFDAQGSTLVFRRASAWRTDELIWQATFHPEDANVFIRNCERCLFTNYNMDWDWRTDPLATFARVTAVNPDEADDANSSVDFELVDYAEHPLYPRPMPIQCVAAMNESRDGFAPAAPSAPGTFYYSLCEGGYGRAMAWLGPNRIRLWPTRPPTDPGTRTRRSDTAQHEKKVSDPTLGRRKVEQYVVGRLYRIAHYYPGKSGIYMEGNRHLTLENGNVYSCRGMAHVIDGPQHHTHLHHVRVAPPPGERRPITATADSCHVANSLGYLKLEDFRVTLNQDDPSNIHDRTSAGRRADARTIEVTHERGNLYFGAKAGDEVEVLNPDFSPLGFRARIVAIDGERLTTDRDIPASMRDGSVLVNRARGTDHVWWKDCVFEGFWGRATMMCNDLTFENCVFRDGTASPLKVQVAFHPARWAEGASATNHVYRGCTFEANQAYGVAPFGWIVSDIFVGSNVRTADYSADLTKSQWNGAVSGILFEKCRFLRPRGALAHFYSGSNLIFRDNEIVVGPADDPGHHPYHGSIFVDFADGVHVSGNRFTSEDPSARAGVHVRKTTTDVAIENRRFRLVLSGAGVAKSLVVKSTGEELLELGAEVPFSTITQNRAYDNEFKLMYAAKPWTLPSERIERVGDELRIRYRDEFFTAVVRLDVTDDYIAFRLVRFDYEQEASGYKRKTEIDSFALAQLPIRRRAHFGRTLNVVWDDRAAVALMAAQPETRIDAFDRDGGGLVLFAGGEKAVGIRVVQTVLAVADGREQLLDCVDAFECDFDLPRGVVSRRDPLHAASYLAVSGITAENVDDYVRIAKEGGFRALMTFGSESLWKSTGHFDPRPSYAEGPSAFKAVADRIRAADIVPGLHFFCTKVSTNDTYLTGGTPDPRMNTVCEVTLAEPCGPDDRTLILQGRNPLLRREPNRGLVRFGDELVMYGGVTDGEPQTLTNCVRGLWNSTRAAHPRSAVGRHLDVDDWVIFVRCAANGITDEIADRIAAWANGAGMRFFYMDGAEDVPEPFWYHVSRVQWNVWRRMKETPIWCETALKSHFGWHLHARGNGFDVFKGEIQRGAMKKYVLRTARQDADDFSFVNLGWMRLQPPLKPDPNRKSWRGQYAASAFSNGTIGTQPDVFEYVCAKGAAWDCPVAVQVSLRDCRAHPLAHDCLRAFRRWEDAKLGHLFTADQLEAFKDENREWFLWPFVPEGTVEPVECRQVTSDLERPMRAFSYVRNGRAGLVYWKIEDGDTPELDFGGLAGRRYEDGRRRFYEADVGEAVLVAAFRKHVPNP